MGERVGWMGWRERARFFVVVCVSFVNTHTHTPHARPLPPLGPHWDRLPPPPRVKAARVKATKGETPSRGALTKKHSPPQWSCFHCTSFSRVASSSLEPTRDLSWDSSAAFWPAAAWTSDCVRGRGGTGWGEREKTKKNGPPEGGCPGFGHSLSAPLSRSPKIARTVSAWALTLLSSLRSRASSSFLK